MPDPVELLVAPELADVVADQLFVLGANAVSEEMVRSDGVELVRLVADPDPTLLAASDLDWQPHEPSPSTAPPPVTMLDIGGTSVEIDALGAFGSGSHPTTLLCAELVPDLVSEGDRVLDVGSGSGVLGVAAAVLGADAVIAVDIDAAAVDATARTAMLNGVADRVVASQTPIEEVDGRYDVVFANLLIPVIEELGPELARHTAPLGRLVLSGVLVGQVDRAVAAVAPMQPERIGERDGWAVVVLGW